MHPFDIAALGLFVLCWVAFEPVLNRLARRRHVVNADMALVRHGWMRRMMGREVRLMDSQFLGHTLNSASFFGSANLLVMAAAGGAMVTGADAIAESPAFRLLASGPAWMVQVKLALVTLTLARGLLEFIWSIRQLNYLLAAIGAAPDQPEEGEAAAWADALTAILNPALRAFSRGVRAYYFALAAAAWLFGPLALAAVTLGAVTLLIWRQASSPTAEGVRKVHALLEDSGQA